MDDGAQEVRRHLAHDELVADEVGHFGERLSVPVAVGNDLDELVLVRRRKDLRSLDDRDLLSGARVAIAQLQLLRAVVNEFVGRESNAGLELEVALVADLAVVVGDAGPG